MSVLSILQKFSKVFCEKCHEKYFEVDMEGDFLLCNSCNISFTYPYKTPILSFNGPYNKGRFEFRGYEKRLYLWIQKDSWTDLHADVEMDFDPQTIDELFDVANRPEFLFL